LSFDVTGLVRAQEAGGHWDPAKLRVTFVPREAPEDLPPVMVGQVSLHYVR